jgi:hypothetical protein
MMRTYTKQMRGYYTAKDVADPRISIHVIKYGPEGIVPGAWRWAVSCGGASLADGDGWARTKRGAERGAELFMSKRVGDADAIADVRRRYGSSTSGRKAAR